MLPILTSPAVINTGRILLTTAACTAVSVGVNLGLQRLLRPKVQQATPKQVATAIKISLATSVMGAKNWTFEQAVADPAWRAAAEAVDAALATTPPTPAAAAPLAQAA